MILHWDADASSPSPPLGRHASSAIYQRHQLGAALPAHKNYCYRREASYRRQSRKIGYPQYAATSHDLHTLWELWTLANDYGFSPASAAFRDQDFGHARGKPDWDMGEERQEMARVG